MENDKLNKLKEGDDEIGNLNDEAPLPSAIQNEENVYDKNNNTNLQVSKENKQGDLKSEPLKLQPIYPYPPPQYPYPYPPPEELKGGQKPPAGYYPPPQYYYYPPPNSNDNNDNTKPDPDKPPSQQQPPFPLPYPYYPPPDEKHPFPYPYPYPYPPYPYPYPQKNDDINQIKKKKEETPQTNRPYEVKDKVVANNDYKTIRKKKDNGKGLLIIFFIYLFFSLVDVLIHIILYVTDDNYKNFVPFIDDGIILLLAIGYFIFYRSRNRKNLQLFLVIFTGVFWFIGLGVRMFTTLLLVHSVFLDILLITIRSFVLMSGFVVSMS